MSQPNLNQLKAKRLFEEESQNSYIADKNVNSWYDIALGVVKKGNFGAMITRSEAVTLGALQMHIVYGNHDKNKHKPGFLKESSKSNFIYSAFRKDLTMETDIYQNHQKMVGITEQDAKKSYIILARVLKRTVENVFDGYIYSADKIEIRSAVLVVGQMITILDSVTQENIYSIPIVTVRAWHNQHTSSTERDKLKKILGHVSHLHQVILDMGDTHPMVRFLLGERDVLRTRIDAMKSHVLSTTKDKEEAEAKMKEEIKKQKTVDTGDLQPIHPQSIMWLVDFEEPISVKEIFVTLIPRKCVIVADNKTKTIIKQITLDNLKCLVPEHTSYEIRNKLSQTDMKGKAYEVHQLCLEGNFEKPLRIFALDRAKVTDAFKVIFDDLEMRGIDEFECLLLIPADNSVKSILLKIQNESILLKDKTGNVFKEINISEIDQIENKRIDSDLKNLFNSDVALVLRLQNISEPIVLGTEHHLNISMELKTLMDSQKKHTNKPSNTAYKVDCQLIDNKNDQSNKEVILNYERSKLYINEKESGNKLLEVDNNSLDRWVFSLQVNNSSPIILQSNSAEEIQNLISLLENLNKKIEKKTDIAEISEQKESIIEKKTDLAEICEQKESIIESKSNLSEVSEKKESTKEEKKVSDDESSGSGKEVIVKDRSPEEDM